MFDTKFAIIAISATVISVVAFVVSVRFMILGLIPRTNFRSKSGVNYILKAMLCFLIALWSFRYLVGYYVALKTIEAGKLPLTAWEEVFNSFLHALKTFSMDEDYEAYVINGKAMLREIFGKNTPLQTVHGVYSALINTMAPIAGGAFVFEILASLFPKVRLYLSHLVPCRPKYYFSELNEASLALATSVFETPTPILKRPYLIFTDAYFDNREEGESELISQAKAIGAICVRDDLAHVSKNKHGKRYFFLIDKSESGNMQTFVELAEPDNSIYLLESEVYLFTNSDAYVEIEKNVMKRLTEQYKLDEPENKDKTPSFIPVLSYRNLISNLLVDVPLYEPIINKPANAFGEKELTVAILGAGDIGTQMFLSTYWFGQILNCKLNIKVISQGTKDEFWSKIDYINPEIRHTTIEGDPILKINRKGDMGPVYCSVEYLQCDVKSSEFISCLKNGDFGVRDADYFFVCIGTDKENISVANTVRKYLGEYNISAEKPSNKIITYVVYNSTLSETLNQNKFYRSNKKDADIYMRAVGSRREVYSARNVFLEEHELFALKMHEAYIKAQNNFEKDSGALNEEARVELFKKKNVQMHQKRIKDEYSHWANRARGMHIKYRAYSMGCIETSLFDYPSNPKEYEEKFVEYFNNYVKKVKGDEATETDFDKKKHEVLLHEMAWLEHRRWNAFMRVMGFRRTNDYPAYSVEGEKGTYKQMDIKLHPCLLECDKNGIRKGENGEFLTLKENADTSNFDLLDDLSNKLFVNKFNNYDFKQYDYPVEIESDIIKTYFSGDKNV